MKYFGLILRIIILCDLFGISKIVRICNVIFVIFGIVLLKVGVSVVLGLCSHYGGVWIMYVDLLFFVIILYTV